MKPDRTGIILVIITAIAVAAGVAILIATWPRSL